MENKNTEKYFLVGLLLASGIFAVLLFQPFLAVLVIGASVAIIFNPLFRWLNTHITGDRHWISALIIVVIFTILVCGPVLAMGAIILEQIRNSYGVILSNGNFDPFLAKMNVTVNNILPKGISIDIADKFSSLLTLLTENLSRIFTSTLNTVFSFLLVLLTVFYFSKDEALWKENILKLSPLSNEKNIKIMTKVVSSIKAIIGGYLFIGLIQGVLMSAGLWLFGVPNSAIWGTLAAVASMVPTVGTAFVSIPAVVYLFATGQTTFAIGFALWAGFLVGTIDNFLSPLIVGKRVDVPPLLILFSLLGGVALLGPIGILVGPLAISFFYIVVGVYRDL